MIATLRLPQTFDPTRLRADLAKIRPEEWVPHFNTAYYEGEWSGVALRAVGGKALTLYPDPAATGGFSDTEVLERCAYFREVLAWFQCPIDSARLLKLKAGSSIREHSDYKLGFEDGELRIHIPIVTDDRVEFYLDGSRVMMAPGECWYMDLNRKHRVDNRSDQDRVHLVVDCILDDWLRGYFPAAGSTPVSESPS